MKGEVIGIFVVEHRVESDHRIRDLDLVAEAYVSEGKKGAFEAVVLKFAGIVFFLDDLDVLGLQPVEDGAVADNGDAVEYHLLELRREGHGDFGAVLDAGFVDDAADIMRVVCLGDEIGLEIEQLIKEAVADVFAGRRFAEIRMAIADPDGGRTGFHFYIG